MACGLSPCLPPPPPVQGRQMAQQQMAQQQFEETPEQFQAFLQHIQAPENFSQFLNQLLSPDPALRVPAEARLEKAKALAPFPLMQTLINALKAGLAGHPSQLAAIILRGCAVVGTSGSGSFVSIPPDQKEIIKSGLLECLQGMCGSNYSKLAQKAIAHAVASLAAVEIKAHAEACPAYVDDSHCANQVPPPTQIACLRVFAYLACEPDDDAMKTNLDQVCRLLLTLLQGDQEIMVRVTASDACSRLICNIDNDDVKNQSLAALNQPCLDLLAQLLNGNDTENCKLLLDNFIMIAEYRAVYLRPHLKPMLTAMTQVACSGHLPSEVRHRALEFVLTYIETNKKGLNTIKAQWNQLQNQLLDLSMQWACDVPEEEGEDWENSADTEDDSLQGTSDHAQGLSAISRLAIELSKTAAKPILERIWIALSTAAPQGVAPWKYPYGGLMALGHATEGLTKPVNEDMANIIQNVVGFLQNPSARVRYAAISCLALMVIEYPDNRIQKQFAHHLFPALTTLLCDPTVRVRAQAAVSTCNFLHKLDLPIFQSYLDQMVQTVGKCLQESLSHSEYAVYQQHLLSAMSSLACQSKEHFAPYYNDIVLLLLNIISATPNSLDAKQTQAKAIEAVGLMTWAVGKEKFLPVAQKVMDTLQAVTKSCAQSDDPRMQECLISFSRVADVVETDFAPYLSTVIPPVLAELTKEISYKTIAEEHEDSDDEEDSDVEEIMIAKNPSDPKSQEHVTVQLKTSDVQDKILALKLLRTYLRSQGQGAWQYIEHVWAAVKQTMVFMFDPDVRMRAAAVVPEILAAGEKAGMDKQTFMMLTEQAVNQILDCIKIETELEVISKQVLALNAVLEKAGENSMSGATLSRIHEIVKQVVEESVKRRKDQLALLNGNEDAFGNEDEDEDSDIEAVELELMMETDVLDSIIDLLSSILKTHTQAFLPVFTQYYVPQLCSELIKKEYSPLEHKMVLCVMGDFSKIVYPVAPDLVQQYIPVCCEAAVAYCKEGEEANNDLVQAAAWYLGVVVETCPAAAASYVQQALQAFATVAMNPTIKEDEDWASALTNIVSAMLKFTAAYGAAEPMCAQDKIFPFILALLPCQGDFIEAKIVHRQIVQLVHDNNAALLGANNSNMNQVVKFLQAMHDDEDLDMVEEDVRQEAHKLLSAAYQLIGGGSPVA